MATAEQENSQRQALIAALADLKSIKAVDLVKEDVLGRELSFKSGLPYFERTLKLFKDLGESNLDVLPHNKLNNLTNIAKEAKRFFDQIQNFSVQQYPSNTANQRDTFISQIRDSYDSNFDAIAPVIAYSVRKSTDFEKLEAEARESVEKFRGLVSEQEQARVRMMAEVEGTLEKIRRAAQEVGVAQHAVHFRQEADECQAAAKRWLIATIIFAGLTLAFGIGSFVYYLNSLASLTVFQSVQLAVTKLILFSILFTGLLWTGRIYKAQRHNHVVNKHRQNALSTFETFAKAASDEQTKSAVLLQATQCIFSAQHTGFITHDSESSGYPQILEIVRNMSNTGVKPS